MPHHRKKVTLHFLRFMMGYVLVRVSLRLIEAFITCNFSNVQFNPSQTRALPIIAWFVVGLYQLCVIVNIITTITAIIILGSTV